MSDDRDDGIPIRRHTIKRNHSPTVAIAALAAVTTAVGVVVLAVTTFDSRQAPADVNDWTARRLAEHLKSAGVIEKWEEVKGGDFGTTEVRMANSSPRRPTILFSTPGKIAGKIVEYDGELSCQSHCYQPGRPVPLATWGKFAIFNESNSTVWYENLASAVKKALPGARVN